MNRKNILVFIFLLLPLLLACQLTTAVSDLASSGGDDPANNEELPFATSATPTPAPQGFSRANPHPPSRTISLPNWEIEIQEFIRGEEAWQRLRAANSNNAPPPEEQEYAMLYVRIVNTGNSENSESVSIGLTGERAVIYRSYLTSLTEPDPWLETYLDAGQTSEGWAALAVYKSEANLLLTLEDQTEFDIPTEFMALSFNAAIPYTGDLLEEIEPTENGRSLTQPAQFGQIATSGDWQVTVLDFKVGEAAWQQVYEANQFNDPAPPGMMHVTAYVRLRYIGASDEAQFVTDSDFNIVDRQGNECEQDSIVNPEPEFRGEMVSGGEAEGWLAFWAEETDPLNLLLVFEPDFSDESSYNRRYFSLVNTGR